MIISLSKIGESYDNDEKSRSTSMVPIRKRRGENSKGVRRTTHDLDQQNIDINLDQQIIDTNWSSRIGEENIASTLS